MTLRDAVLYIKHNQDWHIFTPNQLFNSLSDLGAFKDNRKIRLATKAAIEYGLFSVNDSIKSDDQINRIISRLSDDGFSASIIKEVLNGFTKSSLEMESRYHKIDAMSNSNTSTPICDCVEMPPFGIDYLFERFDNPLLKSVQDDFVMSVEDTFIIRGRGIVTTGKIESGKIKCGDTVKIIGEDEEISSLVVGIEKHAELYDSAIIGQDCGLLLRGLDSENDVKRGYVLYKGVERHAYNIVYVGAYIFDRGTLPKGVKLQVGQQVLLLNRANEVNCDIIQMSHRVEENGDFFSIVLHLEKRVFLEEEDVVMFGIGEDIIGCGLVYKMGVI